MMMLTAVSWSFKFRFESPPERRLAVSNPEDRWLPAGGVDGTDD